MKCIAVSIILFFSFFCLDTGAQQVREEGPCPCGSPPPKKPHRRAGGESFPPLPLPVTPLRRTEKKRPPKPPSLVAKLSYGENTERNSALNDINSLLKWAGKNLQREFGWSVTTMESFSFNPDVVPILYFTGHHSFEFSDTDRKKIRAYVLAGGTLFLNARCGLPAFRQSAETEIKNIFPDKPLRRLPPDHPLFISFYQIDRVEYRLGPDKYTTGLPDIRGIDIGRCRTGVIYSRYDLGCGWDFHTHTEGERVRVKDALKLGVNMVAYISGYYQSGRSLSEARVYQDKSEGARDKFVIGHLIHQADWDPDPNGLTNLLKKVSIHTNCDVGFKPRTLRLTSPELFSCPFLYMTGLYPFNFTEQEVLILRTYLTNGGFLLADSCCGRTEFDQSFRAQMKRVLPDGQWQVLGPAHAVFNIFYKIGKLECIEAITVNKKIAVIYSKYDLGCGWEKMICPYCIGLASEDSIALGVNIIVFALTH